MKKSKHTRRRRAFRWAVYSITVVLLAMIPVSIWIEPTAVLSGPTKQLGGRHRELELNFAITRFTMIYHGSASRNTTFTRAPVSGFSLDYYAHQNLFPPMQSRWWARPMLSRSGGSDGPGTRIELPLAYPAFLMSAWSAWLLKMNRRKYRPGHCPACNYDLAGLESRTCPECGEDTTS